MAYEAKATAVYTVLLFDHAVSKLDVRSSRFGLCMINAVYSVCVHA